MKQPYEPEPTHGASTESDSPADPPPASPHAPQPQEPAEGPPEPMADEDEAPGEAHFIV